jgi:hypothetical protein
MNAKICQRSTSLQDLICYHVDKDVCRQLEHPRSEGENNGSTDRMIALIAGFREIGIPEDAIHILRLVPITHIAWADAPPLADQRTAVLSAAFDSGICPGMIVYKLLETWLTARPDASLFALWNDYIAALRWAMTEESYTQLKNESVLLASATANAMKTCLGTLLSRKPHQAAVEQIEAAFR